MERRVKQRLIGAVILVALGVIFIPMLLKGPVERDRGGIPVEIPPRPGVVPVPDIPKADALYEPAPGRQLVENPPPVDAPTVNSDAERSSPAASEPRSSASVSRSAVPTNPAGEGERAAVTREDNAVGSPAEASHHAAAGETSTSAWAVQVGSFQNRDNARTLRQELQNGGFSTYVEQARYEHKPLFRVRVGPVVGRDEAEQLAVRLHERRGLEGMVVKK